jgi:hypothetical protein
MVNNTWSKEFVWHHEFKGGCDMLGDNSQSGWPAALQNEDSVDRCRRLCASDCSQIAETVAEKLKFQLIVTTLLSVALWRYVAPSNASYQEYCHEQCYDCMRIMVSLSDFLWKIVTGHYTDCFLYNPWSKQWFSIWKLLSLSSAMNFCQLKREGDNGSHFSIGRGLCTMSSVMRLLQ